MNSFSAFLQTDPGIVYAALDEAYHGVALTTTREAWRKEIAVMQEVLSPWKDEKGQILFEYDIPRLGKRIDVVLLFRGIVFCLEFKAGESRILEADVDQVLDYALDLKNFHKFSEKLVIAPILIATRYASASTQIQMSVYDDQVVNPLVTGEAGLSGVISMVLQKFPGLPDVTEQWSISPYAPTPTIIEAARTLYESHSVENITRHEADQVSTDQTISYIFDVIQKSICFVTGVPGAVRRSGISYS